MKQIRMTHLFLCAMALAAAAAGAAQLWPLLTRKAEHARSGSTARILTRSQALSRELGESDKIGDYTTFSSQSYLPDGRTIRRLSVQVSPRKGEGGLVLDWNAETGELMSVRHTTVEPAGGAFSVVSRTEAARLSLSWLRILGIETSSTKPALIDGPNHHPGRVGLTDPGIYAIRSKLPDGEVWMTLQDRSGDLLWADIRKLDNARERK